MLRLVFWPVVAFVFLFVFGLMVPYHAIRKLSARRICAQAYQTHERGIYTADMLVTTPIFSVLFVSVLAYTCSRKG